MTARGKCDQMTWHTEYLKSGLSKKNVLPLWEVYIQTEEFWYSFILDQLNSDGMWEANV